MHIHILGICGTFMGGVALLARELGMTVSGSDANVYPPMSTQLEAAGIALQEGYQQNAEQINEASTTQGQRKPTPRNEQHTVQQNSREINTTQDKRSRPVTTATQFNISTNIRQHKSM